VCLVTACRELSHRFRYLVASLAGEMVAAVFTAWLNTDGESFLDSGNGQSFSFKPSAFALVWIFAHAFFVCMNRRWCRM
jgi:hypothetical protein